MVLSKRRMTILAVFTLTTVVGVTLSMVGSKRATTRSANPPNMRSVVLATSAHTNKRVALVIGNSNYQYSDILPKLDNPVHDSEDIAKALRSFGFKVIERTNQPKEGMDAAIAEFGRELANSDAALFYFAGHALQVRGQNYLMPVNSKVESEAQIPYQSINMNQVLDEIENGQSRVNIVIMDACRNNPLTGEFRTAKLRGLAAPTGSPKDTVIVYATAPGDVAADGAKRNGLFTEGLLSAFKGPDLSLDGVLTTASIEVERISERSGKKQTPYVNGPRTLQKSFWFRPPTPGAANALTKPILPLPTTSQYSLEDIKKQQEARTTWNNWQRDMEQSYTKAEEFHGSPDLQVVAWERFLANYAQDNPYSEVDQQLRKKAQEQYQEALHKNEQEKQRQKPVAIEKPSRSTGVKAIKEREFSGIPFAWIPPGCFKMGSPELEKDRDAKEGPIHEVCLNGFWMGRYEVTQGQWQSVMGNNPASFQKGSAYPIENVSWEDIQLYLRTINAKENTRFRLPTEAEWEYAARAGTSTPFYFGTTLNADTQANYNGNYPYGEGPPGQYRKSTMPVGSFPPNAFGLYDVHGNVWEWLDDWYCEKFYSSLPAKQRNPECKDNASGLRILRGGSWNNDARLLRVAIRIGDPPQHRVSNYGFRLVRLP
ncbi:formylglycine-generating enzyme [Gammaproteobacteria bacterium]